MSSIECLTEVQAADCADALTTTSCSAAALPDDCQLERVADLPWAQTGCLEFVRAFCAADERCGGSAASTCVEAMVGTGKDQADCGRALGLKPSLDRCLADLEVIACDAGDLPASCKDVIVIY
jgi:hypothetical protein